MTKPTNLELRAMVSATETLTALGALMPETLLATLAYPLAEFLADFCDKYSLDGDVISLAPLAIEYYENNITQPNARVKLEVWKSTLELALEKRDKEQSEVSDDLDPDIWNW